MKKGILLVFIICLSLGLRIFKLSDSPKTLYGDEQAFAWNAYSILLYGEDEYGTRLPLQFRSFGDYKAPIPVYLLVPFIKVLGLNSFAIRIPIAVASTILVFVTYLLARLFFNGKVSLITAYFTGISPWLIHLSRGYFETILSLLFFVIGIYFFIRSKVRLRDMLIGAFAFACSLYSYFAPRILIPITLPFLYFYMVSINKTIKRNIISRRSIFSLIFLLILCIPLIKITLLDKGLSRFQKLIGDHDEVVIRTVHLERVASTLPLFWGKVFHNKVTVWTQFILNNYLEHLSLNFWYVYGDNSLRYFLGKMGMFHLFELPLLIIGMYTMLRENKKAALFFLGWILLAPIPASTVGRPFAIRSISMLPAPFVFVSYGLYKMSNALKQQWISVLFYALSGIIVVVSLGYVLIRYYFEYPVYAATWWGWENKAAIDYAKAREDQYENIFISDFYTGGPLAFAVYTSYDPREFRKALDNPVTLADGRQLIKLGKYYYGSLDIDKSRLSQNIIPPKSLYIARPEEADSDYTINALDDERILYKIYTTK